MDAVQRPYGSEPSGAERGEWCRAYRHLFPLPVAPFELLMLLDDSPAFPMTFCVEMVFRGRPDRSGLQQAVDEAVARHPFLSARIEWPRRWPRWVLPGCVETPITWLTDQQRHDGDTFRPINLRCQSGLRVLVCDAEPRTSVWLHFHHACCDGQGARRFAADLLTSYARAAGRTGEPPWDHLDYPSLARRSEFPDSVGDRGQSGTTAWQKIRDAFHFHVLTPQPLAPGPARSAPASAEVDTRGSAGILKHTFDPSQTARLCQLARGRNLRLNDVGLALLFRTVADWNRRYGRAADSQRLRILMPTDLRSAEDRCLPAANRMSFAFLARTLGQCRDWESLVAGIQAESRYCQQVRIGRDFLDGIGLIGQMPALLKRVLHLRRCMATAILTNLGDPTRRFRRRFPVRGGSPVIGNLELDKIFGTPPLRAGMHAGLGMCVCSRQLHLSFQANRKVLGSRADGLMQDYVERWCEWAGTET